MSRDVKQVADIHRAADMQRLLRMLAANAACLHNTDSLASALAVPATTVREYVRILETIFIVRMVPAWTAGAAGRVVRRPKSIFSDSGLASYLVRGAPAASSAGALLENFVLAELARQLTWSEVPAQLYHYRDRNQYEVDGVVEDNAGNIIGVEVKAAETVRGEDFRGLRNLQRRAGDRFRAGFVMYCGEQSLPFGDGLACLPISALWTASAP